MGKSVKHYDCNFCSYSNKPPSLTSPNKCCSEGWLEGPWFRQQEGGENCSTCHLWWCHPHGLRAQPTSQTFAQAKMLSTAVVCNWMHSQLLCFWYQVPLKFPWAFKNQMWCPHVDVSYYQTAWNETCCWNCKIFHLGWICINTFVMM